MNEQPPTVDDVGAQSTLERVLHVRVSGLDHYGLA
jgi:hypothetical protein